MRRFEQELAVLKRRVVEMGALAESMVAGAWQALAGDADAIGRVLSHEMTMDRFQIEIDREAIRLITIFTPVARDLRFLLMIARITTELERIGDEAVDNCEYAQHAAGEPPEALSKMTSTVSAMVHGALQAFQDEDTAKAAAVMKQDDHVDSLDAQIFRELLESQAADRESRARTMRLVLIARSFERVADHATNICEEVLYLVEGSDIRQPTP